MKRKQGYRRGYPVALLVGFQDNRAVVWQVFSQVVKHHLTLELDGRRTDERVLYNFHESVLDSLGPLLKEGTRSVVVAAPVRTAYTADFLDHVRGHHAYLVRSRRQNGVIFAELVGSADQPHDVAELVKTREFREVVAKTTSGEADHIVSELEKNLSNIDSNLAALFSLKEIEEMVYDGEKSSDLGAKCLILTDKYLASGKDKNRIHRLLQISKNRGMRTRIVSAETPAGKRISQFGGIVLFTTQGR